MNGFKFRRCYDTKLNFYRYNNQAVFNLTNDLLNFLVISKSKIKNFKLHRYASFIPTWITKESALLFKHGRRAGFCFLSMELPTVIYEPWLIT